MNPKPPEVAAYFAPLFQFVEGELSAGNNVLIHCLAGAHRAGTAGVACLMHLCDLDMQTAASAQTQFAPPQLDLPGCFLSGLLAVAGHDRADGAACDQPDR